MKLSLVRYMTAVALVSGGLTVALAWASLAVGLSRSDGGVRYPGAERLAVADLRLETLPKGYVNQSGAYRTAEAVRAVLGWYVRHFGLGQANPYGAMGGCLTLAKVEGQLFLQHAFAITLCSQPTGTLIFINRSLSLHW